MDRPVRVVLDVNVFVANIMAHDRGHVGTATQTLVSMVSNQKWGVADRAQLVISFEMIETLETVLRRLQFSNDRIDAYTGSIVDIMKYGPDGLDPYLILGGEERFAMSDVEDAGVLATAFGSEADILVTDNLKDFASNDASVVDTQVVNTTSSGKRTLQALRYEISSADLIIAHPFDVMQWIRLGYDFTPGTLWNTIQKLGYAPGL
ncbi:PIN domain-containing protein [Rhizobium sp. B230/85]|uniref:PIN domain-containing protein n=1 Tax=unclassified Rhizobium TaxID=2613769 RepID=UPI001ADBEBF5|nr:MULTISPECIES: PIN domain-containing protein [unclassified Rhizobium]MBO9133406.1 PIN domain-containing protein [Rhizobium sp. B209b/85]QXZ97411.1 PIN domain-containing protein [Rhizobium sp. B230/85]